MTQNQIFITSDGRSIKKYDYDGKGNKCYTPQYLSIVNRQKRPTVIRRGRNTRSQIKTKQQRWYPP